MAENGQEGQEEQKQEQENGTGKPEEAHPFQVQLEFEKTFFNEIPIKVTPKQELFCQAYIKYGNAAKAYREAFDTSKMKPASVWQCASKLRTNSNVIARLAQLHEKAIDKTIMSSIDVLKNFSDIAKHAAKTVDRLRALENIGKYHQLFKDSAALNIDVPVASNVTVTFVSNKKDTPTDSHPPQTELPKKEGKNE